MSIEVSAGLEEAIREQTEALRESVLAAKVTNALLVAQSLGLDMSEPHASQRVLRTLALVNKYVRTDTNV